MKIINISVANKKATVQGAASIVCGNSDYVVAFAFDGEWEDYPVKTARFSYYGATGLEYMEQTFEGSQVEVPILRNVREVFVGVYAGELHTTTPARIPCIKSILCGSGTHTEPPEDVYAQLLELCNRGGVRGAGVHICGVIAEDETTIETTASTIITAESCTAKAGDLVITRDGKLFRIHAVDSDVVTIHSTGIDLAANERTPVPLAADEGKILAVLNGIWTAVTLDEAGLQPVKAELLALANALEEGLQALTERIDTVAPLIVQEPTQVNVDIKRYDIEQGKTYKIYRKATETTWDNAEVVVPFKIRSTEDGTSTVYSAYISSSVSVWPTFRKYKDYFTFALLDVYAEYIAYGDNNTQLVVHVVMNIDGEEYAYPVSATLLLNKELGDVMPAFLVGTGIEKVYVVNESEVAVNVSALPTVTAADNGKVLRVVDGKWEAVEIASAEGVSF